MSHFYILYMLIKSVQEKKDKQVFQRDENMKCVVNILRCTINSYSKRVNVNGC